MEKLPEDFVLINTAESRKIVNDYGRSKFPHWGNLLENDYIQFTENLLRISTCGHTNGLRLLSLNDFKRLVLKENITETYEIY
jgi:hypothetical protein